MHDKARLLHLRMDPSASADRTAALREKSRAKHDTDAPESNPWNRLAEKFKNYNTYKYDNAVVQPGKISAGGLYVPVPGMEALALTFYDINPCIPTGPIRDGLA